VKVYTLPDGKPASNGAHPLVQSGGKEYDFTKDYSNKYNSRVVYEAEKHVADSSHTNMPPYLVVNFIIKYK
jgi:microcystin-dependent protein